VTEQKKTENRDRLLGLLEESKQTDAAIQDNAQELVKAARLSQDLADSLHKVVEASKDDSVLPLEDWEKLKYSWAVHLDSGKHARDVLGSSVQYTTILSAKVCRCRNDLSGDPSSCIPILTPSMRDHYCTLVATCSIIRIAIWRACSISVAVASRMFCISRRRFVSTITSELGGPNVTNQGA